MYLDSYEARLSITLNDLRLPNIKTLWPKFAEQADRKGRPAAYATIKNTPLIDAERQPAAEENLSSGNDDDRVTDAAT